MATFKISGSQKRYEDGTVRNLEELKTFLEEQSNLDEDDSEFVDVDWTELPTFGGSEPSSTMGVWSWDEHNLLVGTCADDLKIINR